MKKVFEIVEMLRREQHVSLRKLQEETGVAKSTIEEWKKDDSAPKVDKLEILADYFDVSLDYLIGRTANRFSHKNNLSYSTTTIMEASERLHLDKKSTEMIVRIMDAFSDVYKTDI